MSSHSSYIVVSTTRENLIILITQRRTSRAAVAKEAIAVPILIGILYYGYQYLTVYKSPEQFVNKDFVCRSGAFSLSRRQHIHSVYGSHDPKSLVEYVRKSSLSARLSSPDQAVENENARNALLHGSIVNLASNVGEPPSETNTPLTVHVVRTDMSAADVPLLLVRPMNKKYRGQDWYIPASSINAMDLFGK